MSWVIRPLALGDAALICDHRARIFIEDGHPEREVAAARQPFLAWLVAQLHDHAYYGWVAEEDQGAIGSVGLRFLDWPPHPEFPHCAQRGYVTNLFVEPSARGRGLARALMANCEAMAYDRGVPRLLLNASKKGQPFYDRLGWKVASAMTRLVET